MALQFPKILETVGTITGDRPAEVWRRHLAMSFAALSMGKQEKVYHDAIAPIKDNAKALQRHANAFAAMVEDYEGGARFADHLGDYHMELQSSKVAQFGGEYFTPQGLAMAMASLAQDGGGITTTMPEDRPLEVNEPACGSGRMVLAVASSLVDAGYDVHNMRATVADLSESCYYMAYINLTLWAVPAIVRRMNTLSGEVFSQQKTPFYHMARPARYSTNEPPKESPAKQSDDVQPVQLSLF